MLPDNRVKCPATGFARSCREVVTECDCPKFVHVQFVNPQNGEKVDKYGCADAFMPILTILNAQATHQAGASVDMLRGEVKEAGDAAQSERRQALEHLAGTGNIRLAKG